MTRPRHAAPPAASAIGATYVANFGALAASTPFLAIHLAAVGFTPDAAAQVLALCLLVRVIAIPGWTLLADRTRAAGAVLRLVSAGALVVFVTLAVVARPPLAFVALALVAFAVFRAPFGPLLDALMLHRVRVMGGTFGGVRAWGTAGYAAAALVTGALVARVGSRAVLYVSIALLAAALLAAGALGQGDTSAGARGSLRQLTQLARRPRIALLFAIALLQQMGLAPYDALFPAYLARLAGATTSGVAVALGAGSEFLLLLAGASLVRRFGPERLLLLACAASVVRWAAMALVTVPALLVLLQSLHALSFGAFYMASVILVDAESPPHLRASAQGLFNTLCFGVAAALGLSVAGLVESRGGPRAVFGVAAAAAVLATLAAGRLRPPTQPVHGASGG